jgi:chemotaxis response regulator CheB
MEYKKLHVLIVSIFSAHQKAIQAMCASMPQFSTVETVTDTSKALEMLKPGMPDLVIMGANIAENKVKEFLGHLSAISNPPYCIVLTYTENDKDPIQRQGICQVISTRTFSTRFPDILNEVYAV